MESVPKEYVRSYLLGWLYYCGGQFEKTAELYEKTLIWTKRLFGLGYGHLPLCVIADVGHLLLLGSKYPFQSLVEFENTPAEKKLRLRYQSSFLSQIWQNSEFQKVSELVQFVPYKEELIVRALEILFYEVRDLFHLAYQINPIDLRAQSRGLTFNPEEECSRFQEWANKDSFYQESLNQFLSSYSLKKRLFQEEEIYELEHFDVFNKPQIRVLGQQIKKLERFIIPWDRHLYKKRETEEIETEHTDEGYYPTGGLSELTTKGSLENLVFSELVYIEDGEAVDLFDVRYFEQELLYYMRDSGQLRRKRRCLNIILEQDVAFDVTYPGHQYKFSSLLTAFILRIIEDVQKIFESENFIVKIFLDERKCEIGESLKLLKLFLKEEIALNLVLFPQEKNNRKNYTPFSLLDPKRKIHTVYLSITPPPIELKDQKKELHLFPIQIGDFHQQKAKTDYFLDMSQEILPQLAPLRDQIIAEMLHL